MKPLSKQLQITKGHPETEHISKYSIYTSQEHRFALHAEGFGQTVSDHKEHPGSGLLRPNTLISSANRTMA